MTRRWVIVMVDFPERVLLHGLLTSYLTMCRGYVLLINSSVLFRGFSCGFDSGDKHVIRNTQLHSSTETRTFRTPSIDHQALSDELETWLVAKSFVENPKALEFALAVENGA